MHNMLCPPFIFTLGLDDFSKTFLGNNFPPLPAFFLTRAPLSSLACGQLGRNAFLTRTWTWQWKLRYKKYEQETKKVSEANATFMLTLLFEVHLKLNKSFPQSVGESSKMSHFLTMLIFFSDFDEKIRHFKTREIDFRTKNEIVFYEKISYREKLVKLIVEQKMKLYFWGEN